MRKTFAFLGALAAVACYGPPGSVERHIHEFTGAAQGVAMATGQAWAAPLIGGAGALATAVYHGIWGVPGVPAIPRTRAHRKRAERKAVAARAPSRSPTEPG